MNFSENIDLNGRLTISKIYSDGRIEKAFEKDNLIVKAAKQFILTGLYSVGVVSDPIVSLKAGTGGNIDPQGLFPKTEDPLQTTLSATTITLATVSSVDLANLKVSFLADIDQTQCNGQMLTEVGLFKASGDIFNIKNHPGITKTSAFSIHYEWVIRLL